MLIADTGFFVAIANRNDPLHPSAIKLLRHLPEPLITTHPIITETCYVLAGRNSAHLQYGFLRSIGQGFTNVFSLESSHFVRMGILMEKYRELPMDMADASLVVLAETLGHGRILTVDRRDFSIYRWNDRHPFDNQFPH